MENPTKPGMIGVTPENEHESTGAETGGYTKGQFVFAPDTLYYFKALGGDEPVKYSSPIKVILDGNTFFVEQESPEAGLHEVNFYLNRMLPSEYNLQTFIVESFSTCLESNAAVFGGIGTVDIRPTLKKYEWFDPSNPYFFMEWDEANLIIYSPNMPTVCDGN